MFRKYKYTEEKKYKILRAYEDGIGSILEISSMYKINVDYFKNWSYNYRNME